MKKDLTHHQVPEADLYAAFLMLKTEDEVKAFLADLCTPTEVAAFADRWHAARLLHQGFRQRDVAARTGIALATVTRVARFLTHGNGGNLTIIKRGSKPV